MVLAVVDDLLFSSKIREAARAAGMTATFARRREDVIAAIRAGRPTVVILDLDRETWDPIGVIAEIRALPEFASVRLVGFGSHVHAATFAAARAAGCDRVMARSGFVAALPQLVRGNAGDAGGDAS